jgi:hypothetical protein
VEDAVFTEKPVGAARAEGSTGKLEVHGVGRDSRNFQGGHQIRQSPVAALKGEAKATILRISDTCSGLGESRNLP